jgi:hypothetical protein
MPNSKSPPDSGEITGRAKSGRFLPGTRGPGRKKGSKNKVPADIRSLVAANAGEIVTAMIEKAKKGHAHCGAALIRLIVSPMREQAGNIHVDFPKISTVAEAAGAISDTITAVTSGQLSPDSGRDLVAMLAALRVTIESVDLEKRLSAIEDVIKKSKAT